MFNYNTFKKKIKRKIGEIGQENNINITSIKEEMFYNINSAENILKVEIDNNKTVSLQILKLYERYTNKEIKMEIIYEIIYSFITQYEEILEEEREYNEKIPPIEKDNIIFRLVYEEDNRNLLEIVPHRKFLDLAIIYFVSKENHNEDNELDTIETYLITNDMLKNTDLTEKNLYRMALSNTQKKFPLEITNTLDDINEAIEMYENGELDEYFDDDDYEDDEDFIEDEEYNEDEEYDEYDEYDEIDIEDLMELKKTLEDMSEEQLVYYISDEYRIEGSNSLIYNSKVHEIAEFLNNDVYVIIPTMNEASVFSCETSLDLIIQLFFNNIENYALCGTENMISFSIYRYDKKTHNFSIAMSCDDVCKKIDELFEEYEKEYDQYYNDDDDDDLW